LVHTRNQAALLHQKRREMTQVLAHAESMIRLASEHGMAVYEGAGSVLRGWALMMQGHEADCLAQIRQGITEYRSTGAEILVPRWLASLAETYGQRGHPAEGLTALAEALALGHKIGERWEEAELARLKGELLLQQHADYQADAETCFHHALAIARDQQAKSLELRAATSLARLWQQQGKRQEAHDLLAPVYNWFTEGFDTADLQDAKALLEGLEEEQL
jgi:predicted ATPase